MLNILVIEDEVTTCHYFVTILKKHGYSTIACHTGTKALSLVDKQSFDLIFLDLNLPDIQGKELLIKIKSIHPEIPVIVVTGHHDIKTAVDLIKSGASNFITKPFTPETVIEEIKKFENENIASDNKPDKKSDSAEKSKSRKIHLLTKSKPYVIGTAEAALQMHKRLKLVAPTNYSVIIYGESGTGKEMVASAIHNFSNRKDKPFIAVDCGVLTTDLAKSELFGHEKGAFTGAHIQKKGFFEQANGGTLFLDEISNLPSEIQASLLRAIQERKLRRLGSYREIPFDVRLIVASNILLTKAVANRTFREDLFHRINEFSLELTPLRYQKDDLMLYANHFLDMVNKQSNKQIPGFEDEVINLFMSYNWPGNLRELNNVVKRASIFTDNEVISLDHLPDELRHSSQGKRFNRPAFFKSSEPDNLKDVTIRAERNKIISVIKSVNYNKTKAAEKLNIDRKTLYNKIKEYKISI